LASPLLDVDAAGECAAKRPSRPNEAAERAGRRRCRRYSCWRDDVGLQEIIGGLDLALADVGAALQLAIGRPSPFPSRGSASRQAAVDQAEAARLLDEHLDDRLGAAEIELAPPLLVGLDDRERAELLGTLRDLVLAVFLHLAAGRWRPWCCLVLLSDELIVAADAISASSRISITASRRSPTG
jgi:hypothetical protein